MAGNLKGQQQDKKGIKKKKMKEKVKLTSNELFFSFSFDPINELWKYNYHFVLFFQMKKS